MARQFAGFAVGPDGSLVLSANGEGTVVREAGLKRGANLHHGR
ncbi:hypothetical protein ACFU53_26985 [Streptomyces sp. NPDC057474]